MRDCRMYGFAISMYDGCGPTRPRSRSVGETTGAMVSAIAKCDKLEGAGLVASCGVECLQLRMSEIERFDWVFPSRYEPPRSAGNDAHKDCCSVKSTKCRS
jgi:hypothetical protein